MAVSKSLKQQIDEIKRDVNKKSEKLTKELSKEAMKDLVDVHKSIIADFYSYQPKSYKRTFELRDHSRINQLPMKINHGWISGIVVGSFSMQDTYSGDITPDNIFNLMWMKGVRGLPRVGSRILTNSWLFGGIYYDYGENPRKWENPYWSWDSEPYENVFKTSAKINKKTTDYGTPHQVMCSAIYIWGKAQGKSLCNKYAKTIFK